MKSSTRLRSPLSKARGLGSAKSGAHHWWLERMTSLALIPLTVWFLVALLSQLGAPREVVQAWFAAPHVSILFAALMGILLWHTKMGLSVIIEDYVHAHARKHAAVIIKDIVIYALGLAVLFSIVKLHFIGIA